MSDKQGWASRFFLGPLPEQTRDADPDPEPEQAPGVRPPARDVGSLATPDTAMTIGAVYRAFTVLAGAVSQLTLDVWRGDQPIPTPNLVKRPDLAETQSAFFEQTVTSMAASGNAYWRLFRNGPTEPVVSCQVLNPHNVEPGRDEKTGKLTYKYGDKTFKDYEVKHLKLLRVPGSEKGLGPLQAAREEITGQLDLRDYVSRWFVKGGVPNGILSTDLAISGKQADDYESRWIAKQTEKGRSVAVLGSGLKYESVLLSPADALFIDQARLNVTAVARLFGIPTSLMLAAVDGGSDLTYTTLLDVNTNFYRFTLISYLREIEQAMTDLLPRGQVARFNLSGFLRADTKNRYESYAVGLTNGFLTIPEVRAIEGLPPLDDTEHDDAHQESE